MYITFSRTRTLLNQPAFYWGHQRLQWERLPVGPLPLVCDQEGRSSGVIQSISSAVSYTPFTLALSIRSETGFVPMRAFRLQNRIRINELSRFKLNHLPEVVSHWFSIVRVVIASVNAKRTSAESTPNIT